MINSVLSPGVVVQAGAEVRDSVIMNDTTIEAGARVERCILDKQVMVGRDAVVGYGEDLTPNTKEPGNLASGITIVGKGAQIPPGTRIGRNCRIDADVRPGHFDGQEVGSGETISPVNA